MKTNSIKITRIMGVCALSLMMTIGLSCKKDKVEPNNNSNPNGDSSAVNLVATANLNFVDDAHVIDFQCYDQNPYEEAQLIGDTALYLRFRTVNNLGKKVAGPFLLIKLENKNGFSAGQTYNMSDNPVDKVIWLQAVKETSEYITYSAGNEGSNNVNSSAELKITSMDGNQVKGTFSFIAFSASNPGPSKKLIISDGEFTSKINE